MAKEIHFNFEQYDEVITKSCMSRIEKAAEVIRDDAKRILEGKLKGKWKEHGPYKKGASWTAREKGAMVKTIRVVRSRNPQVKNVWVMAGNYNVWWALQMEYGRGGWKGGRKSFMRPAMKGAESRVIAILEGGHGETAI